jgi:hypothetical protein
MNLKRLYPLFACLILYQISYGQIELKEYFKNPPHKLLVKGLQDLNNPNFKTEYLISKSDFLVIVKPFLLPKDNENSKVDSSYRANAIRASDGDLYYFPHIGYTYDLYGIFPLKGPIGCGLVPGAIKFAFMPGKENDAKSFLAARHIQLINPRKNGSFFEHVDLTRFEAEPMYKSNESLIRFEGKRLPKDSVKYYLSTVPMLMEEEFIREMELSGLFQYASRVGLECGGGPTTIAIKRKEVFGTSKPSRQAGIKFVSDFLNSKFPKSVIAKIYPLQDFCYDIVLIGPSAHLSLLEDNIWEKLRVNMFFQNSFDVGPDEIEIHWNLRDVRIAKGSKASIPPLARFDESDKLFSNDLADVENYIYELMEAMAVSNRSKFK